MKTKLPFVAAIIIFIGLCFIGDIVHAIWEIGTFLFVVFVVYMLISEKIKSKRKS